MHVTKKVIELLESDETLRDNARIEANTLSKPLRQRAENLQKIIVSLADEEATPWLSWSLANIVFETANWESVISHFRKEYNNLVPEPW